MSKTFLKKLYETSIKKIIIFYTNKNDYFFNAVLPLCGTGIRPLKIKKYTYEKN
jgi:hypothetical protein